MLCPRLIEPLWLVYLDIAKNAASATERPKERTKSVSALYLLPEGAPIVVGQVRGLVLVAVHLDHVVIRLLFVFLIFFNLYPNFDGSTEWAPKLILSAERKNDRNPGGPRLLPSHAVSAASFGAAP